MANFKDTAGFAYFGEDGAPVRCLSTKDSSGLAYFLEDGRPLFVIAQPTVASSVLYSWWAWSKFGTPLSPEG